MKFYQDSFLKNDSSIISRQVEINPSFLLSVKKFKGVAFKHFQSANLIMSADIDRVQLQYCLQYLGQLAPEKADDKVLMVNFFSKITYSTSWLTLIKSLLTDESQLALVSLQQLNEIKKEAPHLIKKLTLVAKIK